jgi:hypothetical protein
MRNHNPLTPVQRAAIATNQWHFDQYGLFTDLGADDFSFVYVADSTFFPNLQ